MEHSKQGCVTSDAVVRQSQDLVATDINGEVALMSIDSGKYYCLNPTGSRIWQLIEQPRPVSEVCAVLRAEFEVEPNQCESQVIKHVGQLAEENLIEVIDGASA